MGQDRREAVSDETICAQVDWQSESVCSIHSTIVDRALTTLQNVVCRHYTLLVRPNSLGLP